MARNVEQSIKELMAVILNIDAASIDDATSMDNTPGWDSANHINLVLAMEDEFSVSFDVAEFELMTNFVDLVQVVHAKL